MADVTLFIPSHGHLRLVNQLLGDLNVRPSLHGAKALLTFSAPDTSIYQALNEAVQVA